MDLAQLLEKKKKANENNKQNFAKAGKMKTTSNNKMPMRKSGRGK
ncbi:hypothetical protein EV210_103282 [Anaerospora hongkongensis]|uniref:Uncharacterized protein n=1 Tax=Anaerospora hongkongensis TaxID=244830 RepID=A0A4V2Q8W6_9FIRM|nr:hypothetical protein [Anaerospora hongkongensis]TCL38799.1 hypothetical protein EV210_103282 [Anaerospora hongkongensis]